MAARRAATNLPGSGLPWPAEPMLARPTDHLPTAREMPGGCLYEPKWDGYRALVGVDAEGAVRIQSRRGADITASFPDIAAPAARQLPPGTLLDGELVVWGGTQLDFPELQRRLASPARAPALARTRPASFMAFDVLALTGRSLIDVQLRTRRRHLQDLAPTLTPPLQITPATRDHSVARNWLRDYTDAAVGVEGLVVKGLGTRYHPGRRGWLKLRTTHSAEAIVGAVGGSLRAPERLILGLPDDEGTFVVVGASRPLRPRQQREVAALLEPADEQHPWPAEVPMGQTGIWTHERRRPVVRVRPTLVVEVAADTAYAHQPWRQAVQLLRVRPDLGPDEL